MNIRMIIFIVLVASVLGLTAFPYSDAKIFWANWALFASISFLIVLIKRHDINVASLAFVVFLAYILEIPIYALDASLYSTYYFQGWFLLCDLLAFSLVLYRTAILNRILPAHLSEKVQVIPLDFKLGFIYKLFILIGVLSLVEHGLRHLEYFGLAQQAWLYEHARFFYYYGPYVKNVLCIVQIFALIMAAASLTPHIEELREPT